MTKWKYWWKVTLVTLVFYVVVLFFAAGLFGAYTDWLFDRYTHHGPGVNPQLIMPGDVCTLTIELGINTIGGRCAVENPRVVVESEGRSYSCNNVSSDRTRDSEGSLIPADDKYEPASGRITFKLPYDNSLWGKRVTVSYEVETFYPAVFPDAVGVEHFTWDKSFSGKQSTFINVAPRNVNERLTKLRRAWVGTLIVGFVLCFFFVSRVKGPW